MNASLSTVNQIDPDYNAPRDLEVLFGIDHELAPNFAVNATYTYRRGSNSPYMSYIGVNGSDWVPCDSVSGNGYTAPCLDLGAHERRGRGRRELRPAPQRTARTTTAPTAASS